MTTMNSDSESQDSDEGRRFRFEATRKIASDSVHDKKHKATSSSRPHDHDRRSRSRDRSRRERRDERTCHERIRREGTSNRDETRSSKDRKSSLRDELRRRDDESTRHRDSKTILKDSRDFSLRHDSRSRDRRESRSRDEKPLPLRRRSREKSHDKMRHELKSRERRERHYSRDRSSQSEKRRGDNYPPNIDSNEKIEVPAESQDCKDLNLSDFDIVSDTDGDSDTSDGRIELSDKQINRRISDTRMNALDRSGEKVKNRRNGNRSPGPGNSNNDAHALSDFLLGNASTSAPTTCSHNDRENKKYMKQYCTKLNDDVTNDKNDCNGDVRIKAHIDISDGENSDEDSYGPVLPPSHKKTSPKRVEEEPIQSRVIGPSLPAEYRGYISRNVDDHDGNNKDNKGDDEDTFGPALPPHLQGTKSADSKIVGPVLPEKMEDSDCNKMELDNIDYEDESETVDFEAMGPLPFDHPGMETDRIQQQLEFRARLIKKELAQIDSCEESKREEWMMELPEVQTAHLGLAPRKFRSRPGPDMSDRSEWTDTPADRARKQKERQLGKRSRENEPEVEVRVEKSRARHEKSLLELHQKKMHKKKKKEEKAAKESGRPIRRPFDRDVDLKANHFDEARKKRIMMKATSLDDRFSRGKI